ncbi:hypothetical protein N1851_028378 [Merluccius polli]|uniref:Uncharacterized protein n=1 Tax=Merluccius polli TaxID=89951 RepID=A0AA47M923_MERPO|nr:hypothetical protein N1851_028378 [Merluccius polli]
MMMAPVAKKAESFVWTDCEVELLLRLTLDYKANKLQENVDWESCQSKYLDLANAFRAQCPTKATEDFPHAATAVSKVQVTTKLKNIRGKYRRAMDTGRRSGQVRVVMLFYELCQEIWDGSPATRSIESSIETADLEDDSSSRPSTSTEEMPASPHSTDSIDCLPPAVVKQRRDLLQAKLASHRGDRLKRKAHADPAEEELKIKRRTLELAEESARSHAEHDSDQHQHCKHYQHHTGWVCPDEGIAAQTPVCTPPKQQQTIPWVPTIICSYDTTTHYTSLSAHTCTQSIPIPTCTIPTYSNTQPSD